MHVKHSDANATPGSDTSCVNASGLNSATSGLISAGPFDGGASNGLFYPGTLRLPATGEWTLTVTIGEDHGCFLFNAS